MNRIALLLKFNIHGGKWKLLFYLNSNTKTCINCSMCLDICRNYRLMSLNILDFPYIYSINANVRPSVCMYVRFRGKRDFLGSYIR